jgi:hypothetical protein
MYKLEQVLDHTREGVLYVLRAPSGEVLGSTDQGFAKRDLADVCLRLNHARLSG